MSSKNIGISIILVFITLTACTIPAQLASAPAASPTPPQIPTLAIITSAPIILPTDTLIPIRSTIPASPTYYTTTPSPTVTNTRIPTITLTPSLTPTGPTSTPTITLTPSETFTPSPTRPGDPTLTPTTPRINPRNGTYTATISNVGKTARSIYQKGQQLGRNRYAFSKIGDSETWNQHYLQPFTSPHNLGDYQYLEQVVVLYFDSMSRTGEAAKVAYTAEVMVDSGWSNPYNCEKDETPIACEYRRHNPAVALIMVRTWATAGGGQDTPYHYALEEIVRYTMEEGIIPVLSTLPYHTDPWPPVEPMNETIRMVAKKYDVPLWDLWVTTETLPNHGVDDTQHLTIPPDELSANLTPGYLVYGKNRRNLEALEVLHAILNEVITK